MNTALVLSPHLDDAAFSCGGVIARLADGGWRVLVATAFTASVPGPRGFALACQTDKGLAPEVDYMALRRGEDARACALLGAVPLHLDLPEAPHRGYASAPALFAGVRADDGIAAVLAARLRLLADTYEPSLLLAPLALGGHADHRQMVRAVHEAGLHPAWYRDVPYAIRHPDAAADARVAPSAPVRVTIAGVLDRKLAASAAYASQIGFQFGGAAAMAASLTEFAVREGGGEPAELIFPNRVAPDRDLLSLLA